jgi:mannose-6-phosphate isomerase-like protein (cupin superfamily)
MQPHIKKVDLSSEYYFDEGCYITELSNSDDDPSLSIARARVEPGVTTKLHKLIDTIERYVILEGEGLVELQGLEPQKLGVNNVVIIPPNCAQKITNTGSRDLIFLAICMPPFTNRCYQEIKCK